MITYRKRLNLVPGYAMQKVCVSQYDSDIRLEFELYTSEGTFTVESGTTVVIQGTKPDGNGISIDGTLTATQDTDTGTTVYVASFDFDVQMAAVSGKSIYELALYHGSKVLNTANFILFVEKAALDADTIQSDSVLRNLDAIIEGAATATQAAEEAEDAADRAEEAARTLTIDDTLTQARQAADAKKVGDEIADLKDDLDESVETLEAEIEAIEPGLSDEAKQALLNCFAHVAWVDEHGQDYYDALYEALYEPIPQWLLEWSYTDGSLPTTFAPNDWASTYGFGSFVSGKGAHISILSTSGSQNLYPANFETSSNSEYEVKFNFGVLPTVNGLILRLGNGTTGMQVTINANGISVDNGSSYISGVTLETNRDYIVKAIHDTSNGCSLYLDGNLIWTGQTANIGNKKNHILVTIPSGSIDLYISEIKFNTSDSYWDYEWDASSTTLPDGMTAEYYDFTTENGAMFTKTPNLDFDYVGDCIIEVEAKAYSKIEGGSRSFGGNNPQIVIKNSVVSEGQFKGTKIVFNSDLATNPSYSHVAIGVNGTNTLVPDGNADDYHVYKLTAQNNVYSLLIDGQSKSVTQNTNTSPYFSFTGLASADYPTGDGFYGAFIKSIKFKRL